MKDNTMIKHMANFLTQQRETEAELKRAMERELVLICQRYRDVLLDYRETSLQVDKINSDFIQLVEDTPDDGWPDASSDELLEIYDANCAQIEELKAQFYARWGDLPAAYQRETKAVFEKYDNLLAQTHNPATPKHGKEF